ncbi:MAG: elongation factor G [Nitrospirae bacterium]|nr:elongation factor G [Nitrospirota bacterium]
MANVEVGKTRNVALLAHSGAGKTTLTEAILFNCGAITRMGSVTDGNCVTDFEPEEIERKITISSSLAHCEWKGNALNIIDTPGFINFLEDTRICLKAADGAVVLVSATSGVKAETIKVIKYAKEYEIPIIVFINEMDRENASFQTAMERVEQSFDLKPVPLFVPIGEGEELEGLIDVVGSQAFKRSAKGYDPIEVPPDMSSAVAQYRKTLVENVAETDDALLEKYLESGELTTEEIIAGIAKGSLERKLVPVLCGSAQLNFGIQQLIDAIFDCLPSPEKMSSLRSIVAKDVKSGENVSLKTERSAPFAAYVFKTIADPYAGKLTLFRIYSGELRPDSNIHNSTKDSKERVGQIYYLLGKKQIPAQLLGPGEIGVVAKLKETLTGDTLCSEDHQVVFPAIQFAEPIISYAIEPKTKGDEEKVGNGLHRILDEDPTLKFHRDAETHEMIIAGMGQIHVEVALHKLKRKFGVDVDMKPPRVPYRETIRGRSRVQGKYKKQSGGKGQYGDCWIEVEPLPHGAGFEFVDKIVGGSIPRQYIPAVEKGIVDKLKEGIIAGCPMVDIRVSLLDGSYHAVDSSEMAFKIAGSMAIKKAAVEASPVILEPIMKVEAVAPDDNLGAVIGDLNSRRGKVQGVDSQAGGNQKINALVPMAEMLTYANQLHSITSGQGLYSMEFSHYEEVPVHLAQKIIAARSKKEEE